ncbi:MAG: amidohydrolase [Clostridiales bacterium]|nr:amidohydrolase [Clostridiales bacterium]
MDIDKDLLVGWRRLLHMHPEISGKEKDTASYVAQTLAGMGLTVKKGIAGYGVLATLEGDPGKKCVALRADMDALPIEEKNTCIYRSQRPGWMHACGHDAHMAMVLGAAKMISENPPGGTVKFIFQPREEKPPGGARDMVSAGVLRDPYVDVVFGTHISNEFAAGTVAVFDGAVMAVADDFHLAITGKGGHGASPHQTIDTIAVTSQTIVAIQNIHSRRVDPTEPVVLTIGTIHGGTAQNIIPDRVELTGTLRCFNTKVRDKVMEYMHETLKGITSAWGAAYELDYVYGYPPVINTHDLNQVVLEAATRAGAVTEIMEKPFLYGEDFSYYGREVPAAFFFTGSGSERCQRPLHHCSFDIEEDALPIGAKTMALAASFVAGQDK